MSPLPTHTQRHVTISGMNPIILFERPVRDCVVCSKRTDISSMHLFFENFEAFAFRLNMQCCQHLLLRNPNNINFVNKILANVLE